MKNSKLQLIRSAAAGNGGSIMIERAAGDGDTTAMAVAIPKGVGALSIVGKAPVWQRLGVDLNPEANGTYILPYQDAIVAQKVAELSPLTKDLTTPTGILVSPARFGTQKVLTVESISSASDEYLTKLLADMTIAADRKISAEIFTKALAGATEVAATTLTKAGFDLLQAGAEIEMDGCFMANRGTFFEAKGVAIDAGSGIFLAETDEPDKGVTNEGVDFWHSDLFADALTTKRVVYGDPSKIHLAIWPTSEVLIDKVTKASTGQVVFTVNRLACVALMNPAAFAKTVDLA